ncbi:MAG: galactokinase [Spirochaetales bacterium]|nr:galactokinase [Spirochaetales bacterium]
MRNNPFFPTSPGHKETLIKLYEDTNAILNWQKQRYQHLFNIFSSQFHTEPHALYSTPGRIEIGGNHTDHNHGRVLAAGINLDSIAAVSKIKDNTIILYSEGYKEPFIIDLSSLSPVKEETGNTQALIRGITAYLKDSGYAIGGFNASITSDVLRGSGLSSSASIEVLIGSIFNDLYNNNSITPLQIAIAGQYAENKYFGKPCGLMDQLACTMGGIVFIDFALPEKPVIEKVKYHFSSHHYQIVVVNTGGSHSDLTVDYASIPDEMKKIASLLHKDVCRNITKNDMVTTIQELREKAGDRAILRAFHFLVENERVFNQVDALKKDDLKTFLRLVTESGNSSWKWLQNTYSPSHPKDQGIPLGLALTEQFIQQTGEGACRVHGGGFAGTLLTFLPSGAVSDYSLLMQKVFGKKAVNVLTIRHTGTTRVWP